MCWRGGGTRGLSGPRTIGINIKFVDVIFSKRVSCLILSASFPLLGIPFKKNSGVKIIVRRYSCGFLVHDKVLY